MTVNPIRSILLFLLPLFAGAQTQPGGNTKPISDGPRSNLNYEYALNDPLKTRIYTLKNGMKVYLSVYKNLPRIQTFIAVKTGSKNDPADATGLAHYLEHMVFKGTDHFGTKNWAKESVEIKKIENLYEVYRKTTDEKQRKKIYHQIDSISGVAAKYAIANEYDKMLASIGANDNNAFTSFDETVYVSDIPSNQAENWLKIESERFSKLVLRLFHTELEAVYEEKNRGLDNDDEKVFEAMMAAMFKKHTYGTQTTIGTIDHLKNPSMVEINKFFDKYYVPNNMAIVMSGDFDPDKMIVTIEKYFGGMKPKPFDNYRFEPEPPLAGRVYREVVGPDPANVNLAWRLGGAGSKDDDMMTLISGIMFNNTAGLLDLNLNQAQKVLKSDCSYWGLKDYGAFTMSGQPKQGQTLEEVEKLLLSQIDLVKKGQFRDWLPQAVVTNMKLRKTKEMEDNYSRANSLLASFVDGTKWQNEVDKLERLSKISKQEIIDYANRNLSTDNYVVVYKKNGSDTTVQKVEKPQITPVELDRENASPFVQKIMNSVPSPVEPTFINYENDIQKLPVKGDLTLLYNKNTENRLFDLHYKYSMGACSDKMLPVAIKYFPYLATRDMNAAKIKEEFYKLGCNFNVRSDEENTLISITGLSENFDKAIQLFEKMMSDPVIDENVLQNLKNDLVKERNDRKLQKQVILNEAMLNYALYGPSNPITSQISEEELNKLSVNDIKSWITALPKYRHDILYYGPLEGSDVQAVINSYHLVLPSPLDPPAPVKYNVRPMDNSVYVVDYDMKQVEILMVSNGKEFDPSAVPVITLYNGYFGGGMNSVVFQDLRESKALAYSTYAGYRLPKKLGRQGYDIAYIGSQADKLAEAMKGLNDLLNTMPKSENNFLAAKEVILQDIRSQRITRSDIHFNYLQARDLGIKNDIRKDIYEKVKLYNFNDIRKFQEENIKNKPRDYLVLGKKDELDIKALEKYGTVKFLSLKDIFGY
jgi:predicted Zn-dependent peptidase